MSFIGRQESLVEDLILFLTLAGERLNEDLLRKTPRCNVRGGLPSVDFPGFTYQLARDVLKAEADIMDRFY